MKTLDRLFIGAMFAGLLIASLLTHARADTGHESATRIANGSYASVWKLAVSSTSGTALVTQSAKRTQAVCRPLGFNIWIGTTSTAQHNVTHTNISGGFPVYSTETFKIDSFTGDNLYATGESSSGDVRCIDGSSR